MTVSNASIVAALRTLVAYTQLEDGQSQSFRTRAYDKAIDAINARAEPIGDLTLAEVRSRATPHIEKALALNPDLAEAFG